MISSLEDQLKRDEGSKPSAYQDGLGFWTVGIGTCIDARKGCGLTDDEQLFLLRNRLPINEAALSKQFPWTDALDEIRRGALLNMTYQMGLHGLGEFRDFLSKLQTGDYVGASAAMLDSTWAKTQSPARAQRLAQQIISGTWQ